MRPLPFLALVVTLLAGGSLADAHARDRDRDHDRRQDRHERRYEREHEDRGRGEDRSRREEARSRRDEGWGGPGRSRREESRHVDDRFFGRGGGGARESSLVDRRASEGPTASRMSASQAARQAQQRYGGGRVLSVDSMGDGYSVKLLRDGDVRVVFISDH